MTDTELSTRRRQILLAASRLLKHYGFGKTTVADIARESGVGVGTVYLEFASKDAIVTALSSEYHGDVLARMRAAASATGAFAERFRAVFTARTEAFLALGKDGQHAAELVHCACPGVKDMHARFREEEEGLLSTLLEEAHAAREFRVEDARLSAKVVLRAYATFCPPWVFGPPKRAVLDELESMHDALLHGFLRSRP